MDIIVILGVMVIVGAASVALDRRLFGDDAAKRERFRRRLYSLSLKAAVVAFLCGLLFAGWLMLVR